MMHSLLDTSLTAALVQLGKWSVRPFDLLEEPKNKLRSPHEYSIIYSHTHTHKGGSFSSSVCIDLIIDLIVAIILNTII